MLFHPKEPVKILGKWSFQGIFPKRQNELAGKLAKVVSEELFSTDELKEKLTSPEQIGMINQMAESKIHDYLNFQMPKRYPILNFFLTEKNKANVQAEIMNEISDLAPKMIGRYISNLDEHIDVEAIVYGKVSKFSSDRLEQLLMSILEKEFGFIEKIGFVIGFLVGLIQMGMMILQQNLLY